MSYVIKGPRNPRNLKGTRGSPQFLISTWESQILLLLYVRDKKSEPDRTKYANKGKVHSERGLCLQFVHTVYVLFTYLQYLYGDLDL